MRGAVLSALGMQVQEHVLRRHYGSIIWRPFQFGDPTELHHRDLDGDVLCINAFHWYGRMVIVISKSSLMFPERARSVRLRGGGACGNLVRPA